jgi:hypothetical protein
LAKVEHMGSRSEPGAVGPRAGYDKEIVRPEDWNGIALVVDPFVYRIGQLFLEGKAEDANARWKAITSDLGALASFIDLIVLYDQLPAFNYTDTFDMHLTFGDGLGRVVNAEGDRTVLHVDVEHSQYMQTKTAALEQLQNRLGKGIIVPPEIAAEIKASLAAVKYEWEPGLGGLDLSDDDQVRAARFLLGQLTFAGYAQQSGAAHVLAPRRARFIAAAGVGAQRADADAEAEIYREIGRRVAAGGTGWRDDALPWTPSFLPFVLKQVNPYRDGPDVVLARAKDLRDSKAVRRYRKLRTSLLSEDADRSKEARAELSDAADELARALDSGREELELARHVVIEVLPKALSAGAGAAAGFVVAGPAGGIGGAVGGVALEEAVRPINERLWGWAMARLPFRSARKLLSRSVRAEQELKEDLVPRLKIVWETGRR